MKSKVKRKMYMGISRFMVPVPKALSALGMKKSVTGARTKAARLSDEERRIHHFVVKEMAVAEEPITLAVIGEKLNLPEEQVADAVDKLEAMKTFVYREKSAGIDWAYPLSLTDTGYKMAASSGERFFAA
jgi:hypothetical protein